MKNLLLSLCLLSNLFARTQDVHYTPAQVERFAALGKLWGLVNYFHPSMGTGQIITDSLIVKNAASLIKDPSAANFKQATQNMLALLKDPGTRIAETKQDDSSMLFTSNPIRPVVHKMNDGIWYIAFPTASINEAGNLAIPGVMPNQWGEAKAIVLDIRNKSSVNMEGDYLFLYDALPLLKDALLGKKQLPDIYERTIYHNGFVPQTDGTANIYHSGWRTETKGTKSSAGSTGALRKPFMVVVNRYTSADLVKGFLALKATGVCKVIFEGTPADFTYGALISFDLADSLVARIRISDYLYGKNNRLPPPDLFVKKITDSSLNSTFMRQLKKILMAPAALADKPADVSLQYVLPKPGVYGEDLLPPAELRLFGLYNWWNAIHYFFPYKRLIGTDWDSILVKYIPIMINANDSLAYTMAVRSMVSEIHDSHGFLSNVNKITPVRKAFGFWPPIRTAFIEGKLWVIDIAKDSAQDLSSIKLWDEIISIDGKDISTAKNTWRNYFASSNETTFHRDVVFYLLNGPKDSNIRLGVKRDGKLSTLEFIRSGRVELTEKLIDFNDDYPVAKMLSDSVAYINMGALSNNGVDSTFDAFQKTKAIVFDMRNYPQGTAWTIAPRLTSVSKQAVLFDKPMVNYAHVNGGESKENTTSGFTVVPNRKHKTYTGKVIILCNGNTQSQAEYSIMMYQAAINATVIGSQTAGADGNVTTVVLPGGYMASFSGLGILYPDGTQTQRTGIKIDIPVKPTVDGLRKGKDELLERALQFIATGK